MSGFAVMALALAVLYGLGFFQMYKGAMDASKGWSAAFMYAAFWPVTMWKLMKDLWSAPPPSTY